MHAEVVSRSQRNLVRGLTSGLRRDMRRVVQSSQASLKQAQREQTQLRNRLEAQERLRKAEFGRNLDRAVAGFRAIELLARVPEITDYIAAQAAQQKLCNYRGWVQPSFLFYAATRPSGDAWDTDGVVGRGTRDVDMMLCADHLWLRFGSYAADVSVEEDEIPFGLDDAKLREQLKRFATDGRFSGKGALAALDERQREYEWNPQGLIFEVFVASATQKLLKSMLKAAIARKKLS